MRASEGAVTAKAPHASTAGKHGDPLPSRSLRTRRAEQQARKARVAVVLSLFLALLAAALLIGGRIVIDPLLQAAAEAREKNRVGDIVFTMPDGTFCRHLSFDNRTAELDESPVGQCPQIGPHEGKVGANGRFSWGAR